MNDHAAPRRPELVCPAGTPASLRTAVDAGADVVYCGLQNATNARNFPGLNFTPDENCENRSTTPMRGKPRSCWPSTPSPGRPVPVWKDAIGKEAGHKKSREIYRDVRYVVVRNF